MKNSILTNRQRWHRAGLRRCQCRRRWAWNRWSWPKEWTWLLVERISGSPSAPSRFARRRLSTKSSGSKLPSSSCKSKELLRLRWGISFLWYEIYRLLLLFLIFTYKTFYFWITLWYSNRRFSALFILTFVFFI